LRVGIVNVMGSQQTMSLRPNIANLEQQILHELALDSKVVLIRLLRTHVRLKFAEQQDRTKD